MSEAALEETSPADALGNGEYDSSASDSVLKVEAVVSHAAGTPEEEEEGGRAACDSPEATGGGGRRPSRRPKFEGWWDDELLQWEVTKLWRRDKLESPWKVGAAFSTCGGSPPLVIAKEGEGADLWKDCKRDASGQRVFLGGPLTDIVVRLAGGGMVCPSTSIVELVLSLKELS